MKYNEQFTDNDEFLQETAMPAANAELNEEQLSEIAGGCRHPHHTKRRPRIVGYKVVVVWYPFQIKRVPIYR